MNKFAISKHYYLALIVLSTFIVQSTYAQFPSTWFFGQKAAIFFNNGTTITALNGSKMSTPEGCATDESAPGTVTLYCNGEKAWDVAGNVISGFNGSMNSCQSSLFYRPKKADTLLLFTTDDYNGNHGLCYNIFMLKNGWPSLKNKNITLLNSATERMTLANHCDEKSMWLVTHQWNSDAFYSYLIDEHGNIDTPIITHTGSMHNGNKLNAKGCMKISMDGTKLALAKMSDGVVEVFHFDNITGELSDPIMLTGLANAYGIEFSPSGNVLYVSTASGQLVQFSLQTWNANSVKNSKYVINTQAQLYGSLQLGSDYMIYLARDNSYYLARIELPNSMGSSCIYNPTAVYLNGRKSEAGLPQTYYYKTGFDFKGPIVCLGDTSFFEILGDSTRLDSVKWYYGENPILDSSTLFSPYYIFNHLGSYKIKLVIYHCDTNDTIENYAQIVGPPTANLGPDTSFCGNDVKILDGGRAVDYLWDNGITDSTRVINQPGTYWVRLSNSCGESYDTINVLNIYDPPVIKLPPDTSICTGDSIILDAGDDSLLSIWQGNDTSRFYVAKIEGFYQLEKTDSNGCHNMEGLNLSIDEYPEINLGPDTTLCIGHNLIFNGKSQGFYLWQDGSTDSSFTVKEAGTYYVSVRNACGEVHDSCEVLYEDCHQVIWVPNAFTPNEDGLNDIFLPYVENADNYHLYIFDRWGKLIFETRDQNKGWNGYYKGKKAGEDTYVWRIDYTNFSGEKFNQYGYIVLYR